ncbi:MAG: GNAT family N-acetyltransferase [Flavobacteriaceae bacterium]
MSRLRLSPFSRKEFNLFNSWIDSYELLVTIAGTYFKFPLTNDQLEFYMNDPQSHSFNVIDNKENKIIGHAEIIQTESKKCKLDKIIIGDKNQRGKGTGKDLMNVLSDYAFNTLYVEEIELYVYDWNISGIKCYEKVGFEIHENNKILTEFDSKCWTAFQMIISKEAWKI